MSTAGPSALSALVAVSNLACLTLLIAGWRAIRAGLRERHRSIMLANLGVAAAFLVLYIAQVTIEGHQRFPGDDWVRGAFLALLATHTAAAVTLLPLVPVTVYRALGERFEAHRRIARVTLAVWLFVSVTGIVVYVTVNFVRPVA